MTYISGRKIGIIIMSVCCLLTSLGASAKITCGTHVSSLMVNKNGDVIMDMKGLRAEEVHICNVEKRSNGVGPKTCEGIHRTLLAAKLTGKKVVFWFHGNSCRTPNWSQISSDWYHGPSLKD